ncbi:IMPACT family protein [Martelella alba]|uniref:IMPACT family protein n=1 Tax=Martelella alba TaxID=2590451 RepID=A0ABY2SMT1_9HYPH|nr:IMPACT family protein [Martelella alba]TKI07122.1 IMPACT family protein [Martelella alba]
MQSFFVPAAPVSVTAEIKKSRFITLVAPTRGVDAAKGLILQVKADHPSATHHCWAYIAGPPQDSRQYGFSDDGEPSGTAGRPMLAQLQGSGVGEITAVTARYFGGIKLGTGGLVRAYGSGVQQALKLMERREITPRITFIVNCRYGQQAWVELAIKQVEGLIVESDYGETIAFKVAVPFNRVAEAGQKLGDISRGALHLEPLAG